MTEKFITNHVTTNSAFDTIEQLSIKAHGIVVAVAFFSDSTVINNWLESGKKVSLIVSLRPPTNYYSLKEILHKENLEVSFLGDDFHSKIFSFFDNNGKIISTMVGSSNFTNGGLSKNIETNVVLTEEKLLREVNATIKELSKFATKLQPDILDQYKKRYDKFVQYNKSDKSVIKTKQPIKNTRVFRKASEYFDFWKIADKVKDLVGEIAQTEYPTTPEYLVIDHFWHWVVKICDQKRLNTLKGNPSLRDKLIPGFFKEYCKWDKSTENYTVTMGANSRKVQKLLSTKNIASLSRQEAKEIYRSFHAAQSLIQRFDADMKFIQENKIKEIRRSFKHLLDDTLPIDLRIHDLSSPKGTHKLNQLGPSCVQELIGWANPNKMPIRNNKADKAVQLLGFRE